MRTWAGAIDEWACAHTEQLLGQLGPHWVHIQGLARRAAQVGALLPDLERQVLVAAAYLQDIGYATELASTGFHPLDGARHLRTFGYERLAGWSPTTAPPTRMRCCEAWIES